MKLFTVIFLVGILAFAQSGFAQNPPDYLPGKLIIKFEPEPVIARKTRDLGIDPREQVRESMEEHGLTSFQRVFGDNARDVVAQTLSKRNITTPPEEVVDDLSRTFFVDYTGPTNPEVLAAKMAGMPGVAYAEPHYVYYTTQVEPNDSLYGRRGQDYFQYQNFPEAWEISTSSADVVIAIIDSGVFYNHPDLVNKLYRIPQPSPASEVFVAVENDSIGWDFWESGDIFNGEEPVQDNDPIARWSTHGTHVAGIAAAETDNGIGIAGTGFNASFMAVKVGGTQQYPNSVPYGMNGIVYAALNGADIINCSFGGVSFSQFGQDAVNIALESGALVVASAGNTGEAEPFYPASYEGVLSVGSVDTPTSTTQPDARSTYSTYGYDVDVFSTGRAIRSTAFQYNPNDDSWRVTPDSLGYIFSTGTSMSAPVVSGLAALIKHQHPEWSPQRIAYQIRNTARRMDDDHGAEFQHKLGRGVIDALAALTDDMPGLEIVSAAYYNDEGGTLNIGETGFAEYTVINHGAVTSPTVEISSLTNNVTVLESSINLGTIATDEVQTFQLAIRIEEGYNLEETPLFNIEFSDPNRNYHDFSIQEFDDLLYEIMVTDALMMSVSNDGTLGFLHALDQDGGVGFIPVDGENLLFEGGLMIYAEIEDTSFVPNQVRFQDRISRDFSPIRNIAFRSPELADIEASTIFDSSNHPEAGDLRVDLEAFAFQEGALSQLVFLRYTVTNTSDTNYNNVHIGLFNDWDVGNYSANTVAYSESDSLLYVFDEDNGDQPYVAVAHMGVISSAFAIDNTSQMTLEQAETRQDSLNFGVYYDRDIASMDGFTPEEKKISLTAGLEKTSSENTDISTVVATGPFNLQGGGAATVGFIYAYGNDLEDLQQNVQAGRSSNLFRVSEPGTYRNGDQPGIIPEVNRLFQNYPNPFFGETNIQYDLAEPGGHVVLEVYNILGQRVATLVDEQQGEGRRVVPFSAQHLASGVYLIVLRVDGEQFTMKMSLVR